MGTVIPFVAPLDDVTYGVAEQVSPLIRRVMANNPSKYSYRGTGTYLVGHGQVAVIDPGPDLVSHRQALLDALHGEQVRAIVVTHCHADHSPLAAWLAEATGAPRYAYGPHGATVDPGDDVVEDGPDAPHDTEADHREAVDTDFVPDVVTGDGAIIAGPGWTLEAVHTPGHTSNHTCFALAEESALFSGDHVMGWSTTVVSPPDGDMAAYCASLHKVMARAEGIIWPTHGNPITEPAPYLRALLAHRLEREAQILDLVRAGVGDIASMVAILYAQVRPELHRAAARSVLAHLRKLIADGAVAVGGDGRASSGAQYRPV